MGGAWGIQSEATSHTTDVRELKKMCNSVDSKCVDSFRASNISCGPSATTVLRQRASTTTVPRQRASTTTVPRQRASTTTVPRVRASPTTVPRVRASATAVVRQRASATEVPRQRASATTVGEISFCSGCMNSMYDFLCLLLFLPVLLLWGVVTLCFGRWAHLLTGTHCAKHVSDSDPSAAASASHICTASDPT
jgi:hypothetical protein